LKENYPDITKPHAVLLMTPAKAFWRNFETAKEMGWSIADYSEKDGRIEATARSLWFGRTSDIVIRIERAGASGARVDVRAQSESGNQDFGYNLALVKGYFRKLNR
jgi:fatty-acyl-CoA synthase